MHPFRDKLKEGEKLLWSGQPKQGIQLRDADIILIPSTILLTGFTALIDYIFFNYQAPIIYQLVAVVLSLLTIYLGFLRFLFNARIRSGTWYAVTNRRILMVRRKKLKTLPIRNIDSMDRTLEKDGSGFIIFGNTNPVYPWLFGRFYFSSETIPGLEMIPAVLDVFSLIESQWKIVVPDDLKEPAAEQMN